MFCPLMMDSRIGWIQPEQKGPAYKVWSNILEDAASHTNSEILRGREFIPLNGKKSHETADGTAIKNMINSEIIHASKKQRSESITPWRTKGKRYLDGVVGLHVEILDFYEYMKPRAAEQAMREEVVRRVQEVIQGVWPRAKVEVYGSFQTGLYLPTSDIDLVVFGLWESLPLWTLQTALIANSIADASTVKVLDKASVPIIKLTDQKTSVKVDISFNVEAGLKAAEFVKDQVELFPCLPPLIFVLKQFLVLRDLNEVFTGGISSYSLVLMAISFLQHHPRADGRTLESNLGVLLIEFLELYGHNFNYTNVGIRVKGGGSYFSKDQVLRGGDEGVMLLCIEDPFTKGNYIGKSSYKFMEVRQAFNYAFDVLSKPVLRDVCSDNSLNHDRNASIMRKGSEDLGCGYLNRIVQLSSDVVEYRDWIASQWSTCTVPLITQVQPPPPTYASIANKHIQPNVKTQAITSQGMTKKSGTWPLSRSQSNAETLVSDTALLESQNRHPSVDSLGGGLQTRLHSHSSNSVWSEHSVQKLFSSLAEDNSAKKKTVKDANSSNPASNFKSASANSSWTSSPLVDNSYSGVIKQSLNSSSKQTSPGLTSSTSFVDSSSKLVSTTLISSAQKKTIIDEQKSLASNQTNTSLASSLKLVPRACSNLCKDNGTRKQSSTSNKSNNNNNNIQNNNSRNNSSGQKSPTGQNHGKTAKSKKGRRASQS